MSELLRISDVAARLNVSDRTIRNAIRAGTFPAPVKFGRVARWSEGFIEAWLRRQEKVKESEATV